MWEAKERDVLEVLNDRERAGRDGSGSENVRKL